MSPADDTRYTIRPFFESEVMLYKAMRLEALQMEAAVFGSTYEREVAFNEHQWMERITNKGAGCFGLFCNDELVGITGLHIDGDDHSLAHMTQSYIRKAHRRKHLSRMLYDIRIRWANDHHLKTLRIGHKESNIISKAANQRYGFTYAYREPRIWPDGSKEDILYYELAL